MSQPPVPYRIDLDAYLARIGWSGDRSPSARTLRSVHRAHAQTIPFENTEPLLGSTPSIELADVVAKLVHSPRGGYCYEQNTLLAGALEALGFGVTLLAARVRVGRAALRPRTHMLLLVDVPGEPGPYLADVGFGAISLLEAVPLLADREFERGGWRIRLVREPFPGTDGLWVLQSGARGEWSDLYAFTLEPFAPDDFVVANWYVSTHPRSHFRNSLFVQLQGAERQLSLRDRTLTVAYGDGSCEERQLADDRELLRALEQEFGIVLPADTDLLGSRP
ncbi:arylamine N-acetyltransferase [Kitasatospora sp. GP82]|uniref:arylamine N-acetyltransferase family protein n=1 Tax=Kitasatospora sp. GP82 TaxID=3035089 RepID=UPI00247582FC|nr:arylamine N-acetyltransferase [Kitasatospora sp. GP82]MDH6123957.1 N-hydroxyarylamine O-acetyltransferase [Kitasatospora sp. GP82]